VVHIPATADPDQLDAIARKVRNEAQRLGNALEPLTHAAGSAEWRGSAADYFQDDVRKDRQALNNAAESLRELAAAIEKGADEVRKLREYIRQQLEKLREQERDKEPTPAGGMRP
jgi:WXG100 family type VII secretion target